MNSFFYTNMNIPIRMALVFFFGIVTLAACNNPPIVTDNVLEPKQSVEATNRFGTIRIEYVSPTERKYKWDDSAQTVEMIPRKERFLGALGIYNPASRASEGGPVRIVTQESKLRFQKIDDVYRFLYQSSEIMDWVYTRDGLVVGFGKAPDRNQINVDLWQVLVDGRKPSDLRGARDASIHLVGNP